MTILNRFILIVFLLILGISFNTFLYATESPSGVHLSINDACEPPACGAAAVGLVLSLYDKSYSFDDIYHQTIVDSQGHSTVASICKTLASYGINARGCRLSVNELLLRQTPTILYVKNYGGREGRDHFVVYVGHDRNNVKLIDPFYKPFQKPDRNEFEKKWQNVAIITQLNAFENKTRPIWTVTMFFSLILLLSTAGLVYRKF